MTRQNEMPTPVDDLPSGSELPARSRSTIPPVSHSRSRMITSNEESEAEASSALRREDLPLCTAWVPPVALGIEWKTYLAVSTLRCVARAEEQSKVVIYAAVAFELRRNTADQHLSRARRKLRLQGESEAYMPPLPLAIAGRDYLDACESSNAASTWAEAHEALAQRSCERLRTNKQAARAWRAFGAALSSAALRPVHVADALLGACAALGIDHRVPRNNIHTRGWRDLLDDERRPNASQRRAWCVFLGALRFAAKVQAAFERFDAEARAAEGALAALNESYEDLFRVAEGMPPTFTRAKKIFRERVEDASR